MVENGRNNLDCCVVRDLLPAYLEGLTEEETSAQVRAHLEDCENCRELEKDMRAQVPLEKAPKGTLKFLKRVKRTRLLAAVLSVVVALWRTISPVRLEAALTMLKREIPFGLWPGRR